MTDVASLQRSYYGASAAQYDEMHGGDPAHTFALSFLNSVVDHLGVHSILDVGAGTGRVGAFMAEKRPETKVIGIEPVSELREKGYEKGVARSSLINGVADALPFADKSFDLVCAFGVMHHLADPSSAALEMVRVARRAIFISDHNDYGRGSAITKMLKQGAKEAGLWGLYRFLITRGKGYRITEDDGLWYPYSIIDTSKLIRPHCANIHFLNTLGSSPNLYRSASHIAMLGILHS
jgi:SAM-dependent methyltransferase